MMISSRFTLSGVIKALCCVVKILQAQSLASKKRYGEADVALREAYGLLGIALPSPEAPARMNILVAQIRVGQMDGERALHAAEIAALQIRESDKLSGLSRQERRYVLRYCDALIDYCVQWRDGFAPSRILEETFSAKGVRKDLRQLYPLSDGGRIL